MAQRRHLKHPARRLLTGTKGMTSLEFALFAGALTLATAFIAVPFLSSWTGADNPSFALQGDIDPIATGSVRPAGDDGKRVLRISRSVLQNPSDPPCIVYTDGSSNGYC